VPPASPPTATTNRAGIVEGSPAGERSGRGAVPRPAQDGEPPTVDQSREWPYRDTAPRQDPAESRLDPIWGSDPPDAVRWHMDMTPEQLPGSSAPAEPIDPRRGTETGEGPAMPPVPIPPAASTTQEAAPAGSADNTDQAPTATGLPGHGEHHPAPGREEAGEGLDGSPPAAADAGLPAAPAGATLRHGQAPEAFEADEGPSNGEPMPTADAASAVGWFSAGADPARFTETLSGRLSAERPVDEPTHAPSATDQDPSHAPQDTGVEAPGVVAGSSGSGDVIDEEVEASEVNSGSSGSGDTDGIEASGEDTGGTEAGAAVVAGSSGVAEAAGADTLTSAGEAGRPGTTELGVRGPGTEGPSAEGLRPGGEDGIGSVGTEGTGGLTQQTGNDEAAPGTGGSEDGQSVPHPEPLAAEPLHAAEASTGNPVHAPGSADATANHVTELGGPEPHGPELIAAGMVYVDPDPEIDSPPTAAGWGDQSPASSGSTAPPHASGQEAETRRLESDATGHAGPEPAGEPPLAAVDAVRDQPAVAPDAPTTSSLGGADLDLEPESWKEPVLPMGLPAGPPPAGAMDPEGGWSQDPDVSDDELPKPDPSWPRLFEGSSGGQEDGGRSETQGPGGTQQLGPEPASHQDQRHGEQPEPRGATGGYEATPSVASVQPVEPPVVVDITAGAGTDSGSEATGAIGQSITAVGPGLGPTTAEESARVPEQASVSTVARIGDAEEVDLRETPVSLPSGDVSRETSAGGGEEMDGAHEEEALEDEAALAVRDAVSRAAAEAGVDVSRETEAPDSVGALDELAGAEPSIDSESAARNARVTFRIHRESLNGTRRVLAVANQKGGVGKSTTAVNIGAYLALAGARVLVVDLDPQGNASTGLGLDHREIEPSIYDVLTGEAAPTAAIRATSVANLHVLPSTIDLAGAEVELVSAMSRETRLRRALESVDHQYDTILIDCPPSLGLLTVNALAAANELLIPIQCEYYALEGLGQLLRNVELVRANLNPELRIGGIVLTMYDGRTRLALQVVEEVRKHFTDVVYQTVVPRSVRLSEAPGYGLPIALYDPLSRGGIAYRDLTFELAERSGLLAPTGEGAS
jgi:chromosome partitioning protein